MYFYCDTITRRVANQGYRSTFFPWAKTDPAGHKPSFSLSKSAEASFYVMVNFLSTVEPVYNSHFWDH